MKISYSGYNKYMSCPRMFKLHYINRIREKSIGSALVFGQYVDTELNKLLGGPDEIFEWPEDRIIWDKVDYDGSLLTECEKTDILNYANELGYKGDNIDELLYDLFKLIGRNGIKYNLLSSNQESVIDFACRICVEKKVEKIIDKYKKTVLPLLSNIQKIQYEVKFGNKYRGFVDFVAEYDGNLVLFDNKTSKRPYMNNSVKESMQLALYASELNIDIGGYIVIQKNFKKGEPQIQIITDYIPEKMKELSNEAMNKVHSAVENFVFPANLNSCTKYFGKPCPYKNYCHNDSMEGLYKKEER